MQKYRKIVPNFESKILKGKITLLTKISATFKRNERIKRTHH